MNSPNDPATSIESVLYSPWPVPIWLSILVAVALFAGVFWLYMSERGGADTRLRSLLAAIRFCLLALVLWMIAGWSWQRFRSDRPELLVVVDQSASMATRDVSVDGSSAQISRLDFAKQLFASASRQSQADIGNRYQVKWYAVADKAQSLDADLSDGNTGLRQAAEELLGPLGADGAASRLGDALSRLVDRQAGRGTAAIIFISDGISTAGASLADASSKARRGAIPVHSVVVGQQFVQPDLRLADLLVDREVYFGDQVAAEFSIVASDIPQTTVRVSLIDDSNNQVLDTTSVDLASEDNQQTVRLTFVPARAGEIPLQIKVESVRGEVDTTNNTLKTTVNVQDKSIRVLMVFETPNYEFRFLKSLLERVQEGGETRSSSFELSSILQDADPTYVEQDSTAMRLVPSSSDTLLGYDVFVFGEINPSLISRNSQQAIVDAVTQKGAGAIFVYGGGSVRALQNWPLSKLLPVEFAASGAGDGAAVQGPWQWQPTSLGMASLPMQLASSPRETMAVWKSLPPIHTLADIGRSKTGSQVLAEAVSSDSMANAPLLITQFAGAGRTAFQATDESYVMTSVGGTDQYHQRYWGQMLRWLSRGKLNRGAEQSTLVVDPKQVRLGQPIRLQLALGTSTASQFDLPQSAEVMLEASDGGSRTVELRQANPNLATYQATIDGLAPGKYRAVLLRPVEETPPDVEFTVTAPPGEQANLRADLESMKSLAERTRGRYYTSETASELFTQLPSGKPTRLGSLPPLPLWNSQIVAMLFVGLLTVEWVLRRKARML